MVEKKSLKVQLILKLWTLSGFGWPKGEEKLLILRFAPRLSCSLFWQVLSGMWRRNYTNHKRWTASGWMDCTWPSEKPSLTFLQYGSANHENRTAWCLCRGRVQVKRGLNVCSFSFPFLARNFCNRCYSLLHQEEEESRALPWRGFCISFLQTYTAQSFEFIAIKV